MRFTIATALAGALTTGAAHAAPAPAAIVAAPSPPSLRALPASVSGRVSPEGTGYRYQWPGIYFEAAFEGRELYFKVEPGEVILHVLVDSARLEDMVKPAPGWYRIGGLAPGAHTVRLESVSENQSGPRLFGGFALPDGAQPLPMARRARQIEFIGDSHTVGYGNISATRDCNQDQVWAQTDNSQGYGAMTARRYNADYRVHAISGRGVVRNFDGAAGDTLPAAYPYVLFDHAQRDTAAAWQPKWIVVSLGTNDFSTALHPGEKWVSREALHADYEAAYVEFVLGLRARNPQARFILWATDGANGEIQAELKTVVARLKAAGESRVAFIPVNGLAFTGCHWHPSVADDKTIADALAGVIDAADPGTNP
ncbi:MAG: GDSL-type esterase/lipase family protein [Pseudomonadota bacterium]